LEWRLSLKHSSTNYGVPCHRRSRQENSLDAKESSGFTGGLKGKGDGAGSTSHSSLCWMEKAEP
jgi:hypothetical protein